jgi:chromosome segregation ATPase
MSWPIVDLDSDAATMPDPELVQRVERLERTVDSLSDLPERTTRLEVRMANVETQIVHLRTEMRDEFSAVRRDMSVMKTELRGEMANLGTELRGEMANLGAQLREDIAGVTRDLAGQMLEIESRQQAQTEALRDLIVMKREGNPPTG